MKRLGAAIADWIAALGLPDSPPPELPRDPAELHRQVHRLARAVPLCPVCSTPLVFRESGRRFIEADNYVECAHGHVWALVDAAVADATKHGGHA